MAQMPAKRLRLSFYSLAVSERQRDCGQRGGSVGARTIVRLSRFVGQRARNCSWTFPRATRNFAAFRLLISRANKAAKETDD